MNIVRKKPQPATGKTMVVLFILLIVGSTLNAQNTGRIEGRLISSTSKPVMLATAALFSLPDSLLVEGVITDTTGYFEYSNLPFGSYVIKFRNIGYKNTTLGSIELSSAAPTVDLHSVIMEKNVINLSEVAIIGKQMKGTSKIDKTVYPVNEKAVSVSNTGLDLLRLVPGVQVDFSKKVSLQGSKNILIFVDDKLRDESFLAQLDPKSIDKVEVMTNPSVKYGADVTGVINIKLKRDRKGGFSGNIMGEQTLNFDACYSDLTLNMEYGTGRFRLYSSGSGVYQDFRFEGRTIRNNSIGVVDYRQNSHGQASYGWAGIYYGIDWFVNEKNTLNFYGYSSPRIGSENDTDESKEWFTNGITSNYLTNSPIVQNASDKAGYYGVFYKHQFNKPAHEFTFDAQYYSNNNVDEKEYNEQYFQADKFTPIGESNYRREKADNYIKAINLKADYTQTFLEKVKLDIGYQNNIQWNTYHFIASNVNASHFKYSELRNAAYANFSGKVKELSWQLGLRFESSDIEINEESGFDYTCWLPQVSFQQKLSDKQSLKLSYRRSIQRPGIGQLNPFVFNIDSLNTVMGNPNLKPALSNKIEFSCPIQQGTDYLSPGFYVNAFADGFEQVKTVIGNKSVTYVDNIGKGFEYGINFSGSLTINKWLALYPYFRVYRKKLDEIAQYGISATKKVSFETSIYCLISLPKDFSVTNFYTFGSPYLSGQNTIKHGAVWLFEVHKQLFKNKAGKLTLLAFNPFNTTYLMNKTETRGSNFYETNNNALIISNYWAVKFSYSFQKRGNKIKKLIRQKNEPIGRGKGLL